MPPNGDNRARADRGFSDGVSDMATKERIIPPSRKDVKEAARTLPGGSGTGGRVLSEQKTAKQQHVKPRSK